MGISGAGSNEPETHGIQVEVYRLEDEVTTFHDIALELKVKHGFFYIFGIPHYAPDEPNRERQLYRHKTGTVLVSSYDTAKGGNEYFSFFGERDGIDTTKQELINCMKDDLSSKLKTQINNLQLEEEI